MTGKTTLTEELMRGEKARLKFVYDHDGQFASRFNHEPDLQRSGTLTRLASKADGLSTTPLLILNRIFQRD